MMFREVETEVASRGTFYIVFMIPDRFLLIPKELIPKYSNLSNSLCPLRKADYILAVQIVK